MFSELRQTPRAIRLGAALFTLGVFLISWWHWWTFQYGTFDLAFYVQALWLALHGKWWVSLLNVPLMGNHAEPIVFLLAPLFAVCPHPMLLVAVQTLALATMAFTGYRIATRLGFERAPASALGLALLVTPATASVGIYEFHPEALVAPLLLLLIEAKLAENHRRYWLWFVAVLACKENMALLLVAFCGVFALLEWKRDRVWQWRWNLLPALVAGVWLIFCGAVISPWLNAGNVDYGQLYAHLGNGGADIVKNFFIAPGRAFGALRQALTGGDLVWALLLPLLLLPLMRPRWLLIAAPLLLQHLLSWRFTEWSLGAHYPAPFIPLFWIAAVEAIVRLNRQRGLAFAVALACLLANARFGIARELIAEWPALGARLEEREWKAQMLAEIPPSASVTACQPYLSHLAKRERVFSLHHVLKGLKTLSKEPYVAPQTEAVVIDYGDTSTFSPPAGFYHPRSRVDAERFVASSDQLLHEFLRQQKWQVSERNEFALFTRGEAAATPSSGPTPVVFDAQTTLADLQISQAQPGAMRFRFTWDFGADRDRFPWMMLVLSDGHHLSSLLKGACAPEAGPGRYPEEWTVVFPEWMAPANYDLFAVFYDATEAAWNKKQPPDDMTYVIRQINLGHHEIRPGDFGNASASQPPR